MEKRTKQKNNWKKRIILICLATLGVTTLTSCSKKENIHSVEQEEEIDSTEVYTYTYKKTNLELFRYKYNGVYHTEIFLYQGKEAETGLDYFTSVTNPQHIVRSNETDLVEFEMDTGDEIYKTSDILYGDSYKYLYDKEQTYFSFEEIFEIEKSIKAEEIEIYETVENLSEKYCNNYKPKNTYLRTINDASGKINNNIRSFSYIYNGYRFWIITERKLESNGKEYFISITNPNIIIIMGILSSKYDCTAFIIEDGNLIELEGVYYEPSLTKEFDDKVTYEEIFESELRNSPHKIEDETTKNLNRN